MSYLHYVYKKFWKVEINDGINTNHLLTIIDDNKDTILAQYKHYFPEEIYDHSIFDISTFNKNIPYRKNDIMKIQMLESMTDDNLWAYALKKFSLSSLHYIDGFLGRDISKNTYLLLELADRKKMSVSEIIKNLQDNIVDYSNIVRLHKDGHYYFSIQKFYHTLDIKSTPQYPLDRKKLLHEIFSKHDSTVKEIILDIVLLLVDHDSDTLGHVLYDLLTISQHYGIRLQLKHPHRLLTHLTLTTRELPKEHLDVILAYVNHRDYHISEAMMLSEQMFFTIECISATATDSQHSKESFLMYMPKNDYALYYVVKKILLNVDNIKNCVFMLGDTLPVYPEYLNMLHQYFHPEMTEFMFCCLIDKMLVHASNNMSYKTFSDDEFKNNYALLT